MAIDIYNSRRTHYHKCSYWLRNENDFDDDDILKHNLKPSGVFFAKELDNINEDTRETGGVWQYEYTRLKLETSDKVEGLIKNSYVEFENEIYVVDGVEIKHVHKRHQFNKNGSVLTYIYLRGK